VPTPRGGGLAVLAALLPAWAFLSLVAAPPETFVAVLGAAGLAFISFADDLRSLPALLRLAAQATAVALGLAFLPGAGGVFQGYLPPWLDMLLAALLWLWFINLYNFMDGIDGIAGAETVAIGFGLALLGTVHRGAGAAGQVALGLAAGMAALGFLRWNWHPAKIFLGDVGSVPLGYLLGWLLLATAAAGFWKAALVIPAYYLVDATVTLGRRLLRRERIWEAHREHFYQRLVRRGWPHDRVVRWVIALDVVLVLAALAI
jgi:UDP-N-acetylmuramyl pentapeptide phosphotransferase/UDP-N-acetylglucosamine-1-phosphate transferase